MRLPHSHDRDDDDDDDDIANVQHRRKYTYQFVRKCIALHLYLFHVAPKIMTWFISDTNVLVDEFVNQM
jgi:hypothetical protein